MSRSRRNHGLARSNGEFWEAIGAHGGIANPQHQGIMPSIMPSSSANWAAARPRRYAPLVSMIRNMIVRVLELAVFLLASYVFWFVPVGRRTPYGHLAAIFSTTPAHEAAEDFASAGKKLRDKVADEAKGNSDLERAPRR